MDDLDWTRLRSFLAVAETGSLSGAARQLRQSQPTLGRHIRALEAAAGSALFRRHPRGLVPTAAGAALLPHARAMQAAAHGAQMAVAGQDARLEGPVRLTASRVMAATHLPPILAQLRQHAPGITIDLLADDDSQNLLFREADIALRMYRPRQEALIAQYLGEMAIVAFASRAYLARRAPPRALGDLREHDLVGMDQSPRLIGGLAAGGLALTRDDFALRSDDPMAYFALVRAGGGIGFGQERLIAADPELVLLDLGGPIPGLPLWITAHETMRRTPRIRHVWDHLSAALRALTAPVS